MKILILILILTNLSCQEASNKSSKNKTPANDHIEGQVIYGDDNRRDIYEVSDTFLLDRARSTLALVEEAQIHRAVGGWTLSSENFGQSQQLCNSERFKEQNTAAFCSGSLVGPDLVITAGHCVRTQATCSKTKFVFDFNVEKPGAQRSQFSENQVYGCRELVASVMQESGADYAVVKLDRIVQGRNPLLVNRANSISVNTGVFVIGHPVGLPMKITTDAKVRKIESSYFVTNLDTYGGNSGSPVFNSVTGAIEGILVRGEQDFLWSGGCNVSKRCVANECRGEDVTKISELLRYIPGDQPKPPAPSNVRYEISVIENKKVPDNSRAGISSSLIATEAPNGKKVKIEIELKHTYRGDLQILLVTPDQKTLALHNRTGGSADDIIGAYGESLTTSADVASLSKVTQVGVWKLVVRDLAEADLGTLVSWGLKFQ